MTRPYDAIHLVRQTRLIFIIMLHIGMPISFVLMNPVYSLYSIECAEYYHLTLLFLIQNRMETGALPVEDRTGESSHTLERMHWQCVMCIRTTSFRALQGLTRHGAM
jgi:hypothetical protein